MTKREEKILKLAEIIPTLSDEKFKDFLAFCEESKYPKKMIDCVKLIREGKV